jgi:4-aminobutyrate aminotransferase-like enzyme
LHVKPYSLHHVHHTHFLLAHLHVKPYSLHDAQHTIVVERAYHGHTCETIGISPYKYKKGTGAVPGSVKPEWVTEVEAPDTYVMFSSTCSVLVSS